MFWIDHAFYACDAGCLDPPVRLQATAESFPVKLTEPLTSLLYITPDREHITELKHSIHVKEVNEAPAHEHHTIAIHKYGHSLGGLPTIFWVAILILIVAFHFFLGKLIYNEYINNSDSNYRYEKLNSGRYSMWFQPPRPSLSDCFFSLLFLLFISFWYFCAL